MFDKYSLLLALVSEIKVNLMLISEAKSKKEKNILIKELISDINWMQEEVFNNED